MKSGSKDFVNSGPLKIKCCDQKEVDFKPEYIINYPTLADLILVNTGPSRGLSVNSLVLKEIKFFLYHGHVKENLSEDFLEELFKFEKVLKFDFFRMQIAICLLQNIRRDYISVEKGVKLAEEYNFDNLAMKFRGMFSR